MQIEKKIAKGAW